MHIPWLIIICIALIIVGIASHGKGKGETLVTMFALAAVVGVIILFKGP